MSRVRADESGIQITEDCFSTGTCKLNIYQTLQIREDTDGQNNAEFFVQDIFLTATFFVGTFATFSFIVSGLMMVFGGNNEALFEKGKNGLKYTIIGVILVLMSYTAIRVVQFIAQGQR